MLETHCKRESTTDTCKLSFGTYVQVCTQLQKLRFFCVFAKNIWESIHVGVDVLPSSFHLNGHI